jgi:hypothetical protein
MIVQNLFDGDLDGAGPGRFGLGQAQGQHTVGNAGFGFPSVECNRQAQGPAERAVWQLAHQVLGVIRFELACDGDNVIPAALEKAGAL